MINLCHGNLLNEQVDAVVNTVNCVGIMGKGIALQFKKKWPENFDIYNRACKAGEVKPGKIFVYHLTNNATTKPQYIINFPTKNHWKEKSKLSYIKEGLIDLINFIKENNIQSIAIPPLGCGNGGLKWEIVKPLIESAFLSLQNIDVRLFEPGEKLNSENMIINTRKPPLTTGRAIVIKLIDLYIAMDYFLSKIEIQKLCYFAQEIGALSKLRFVKNQFGPYADNLRHVLDIMDGHYIAGVGDHNTIQAKISLTSNALQEANDFLNRDYEIQRKIQKIQELISGFETPYGMELLATVHWAAKDLNSNDIELVKTAIHNWEPAMPKWNERKKALMSKEHIRIALNRLCQLGWL